MGSNKLEKLIDLSNISVNIDYLLEKELSPNQYIYSLLLLLDRKEELLALFKIDNEKKVKHDLYKLYTKHIIENDFENLEEFTLETLEALILTKEAKNLITTTSTYKDINEFMDIWYNIFPKGIYSGGYLVRSGKAGCTIKMVKFIKNNPEFSKELIIRATKLYVSQCASKGYTYMQLAEHFIYKNNKSTLASLCESLMDTTTPESTPTKAYGTSRG
jgi:hypothetical protein